MSAASRRASLAAAKDAKMKKVAIAGGVVLLALLGYQGPKILHRLHGTSTAAADTSTVDTAAPSAVPPPPTLVDPPPLQPGPGQLVSFGLFKTKDPFVQQLSPEAPASSGNPPGYKNPTPTSPVAPSPTEATTATSTTTATPTTTTTAPTPAPTIPLPTSPATTPTTTTPAPTTPAQSTVALATNGACEIVEVKHAFPAATPLFQLVSIAPDGLSVQIGIAGGSLESGQATVTLTNGKPLTLVNTADGIRYTLELLGSCPAPTSTTPTATAPTSTSP